MIGLAAAPAQAAGSWCGGLQGPYQKQAERFLGLPADGVQTAADCREIRSFQASHGIQPQYGYAGPVTWKVMKTVKRQEAAGRQPNQAGSCPVNKGRIACVDLTRQISWIQDGAELRKGPVPVRTGRNGHETRTGLYKIYWRNRHHVSTLYDSKMPYSQFFDGGEAFHAISGSVWSEPGSHGCVNMRTADAKAYWKLLRHADDVYVYGRKPGT
ncbi:L,D-transpeptidase [Streptomyces sp. N2-109]|uniref:L,D-transpeptidase n=2 Tax=Streptomyces gossypii TaxID=2883101 RepID=A0ABT2K1C3_9ACTN|nr:L,D-transpeptidase [Streptomyces gossypii]MCT2593335.1 L,D-transpeptidase [Streptomyces gossypii]